MRDVTINLRAIKELVNTPKGSTKVFLWDREVRGFGVYKTSRGYATFVYQFRMPGQKSQREMLGQLGELTCEQARDLARDRAYARRRGINPIDERRNARLEDKAKLGLVLRTYAEAFIEARETGATPLTKPVCRIIRNDICGVLGDERIDKLTVESVERMMKIMRKRSATAERWSIVYLKVIMNDAKRRGKIVYSPTDAIKTPASGERSRVLNGDELCRLLEAGHDMDGPAGEIYVCLTRTMKRAEEVADLVWEEIDTKSWTWNLPKERSKNRVAQTIILPRQVKEILERRQPDPRLRKGYVFSVKANNSLWLSSIVKERFHAHIQRRAELYSSVNKQPPMIYTHFTTHDIRTSGATMMQRKPLSVPPHIIEAVLNHVVRSKVQGTYQRDKYVDEVGEALARYNDHLDTLLAEKGCWPGGKNLPAMDPEEFPARAALFRDGWPIRSGYIKRDKGAADESETITDE